MFSILDRPFSAPSTPTEVPEESVFKSYSDKRSNEKEPVEKTEEMVDENHEMAKINFDEKFPIFSSLLGWTRCEIVDSRSII